MPVFKNDGLEVLAFVLDAKQDIIRQIGVCLNDEERRRAQGFGTGAGPPPPRCCPRAAKDDSANAAEHKTDCDPGTQRARWWASPSLRG